MRVQKEKGPYLLRKKKKKKKKKEKKEGRGVIFFPLFTREENWRGL